MIRLLRGLLYWVSVLAGITGVVAGGKSLGKYLKARWSDPYFDSFSYNDLVFSGGVIVLLSLILLIFADIGLILGRTARAVKMDKAGPNLNPSASSSSVAAVSAAPVVEPENQAQQESADEKLARLLKQKQG